MSLRQRKKSSETSDYKCIRCVSTCVNVCQSGPDVNLLTITRHDQIRMSIEPQVINRLACFDMYLLYSSIVKFYCIVLCISGIRRIHNKNEI